ncbi:hypothetical protein [Paenibacillus solani]|uniref:Uncharacterized protein n=1 Tax=Paenibacillus solani TaxID=1705565 RepID=A0A0M1P3Z6_9BACL|nr:hypothetical protein [Paenibacillus solani]KOR88759.1 hypothetical protein AM231_05985 [Paenibacillus solani]
MRDVFAQRDKERRSIRKELNSLYRRFMEAHSANDLKLMISLDQRIRALKGTLLRIDPVEEPESCNRIPKNEQRSRLGNVI